MRVLGIETTCDETAAAVVSLCADGRGEILSNEVLSQIAEHSAYGGVVPEIAARAHVEVIDRLVGRAMDRAALSFADLDGIAAAAGPGLIGGVLIGLTTAKALSLVTGKPLLAVNHLEGHALTARLTDGIGFPYLLLLASGGHTQLVAVRGVGDYVRLGTTVDDAVGEAFDKVAKLLGLGYPGGPEVEREAGRGDPERFDLPRPMLGRPQPNFSLSGLKTALRMEAERIAPLTGTDIADLCASFQAAVVDVIADRTRVALRAFRDIAGPPGRAGRRRRGRGQPDNPPRPRAARRRGRPPHDRAAPAAVRRQRRHHRLGRARAVATRADRRPDRAGAGALAAGRAGWRHACQRIARPDVTCPTIRSPSSAGEPGARRSRKPPPRPGATSSCGCAIRNAPGKCRRAAATLVISPTSPCMAASG